MTPSARPIPRSLWVLLLLMLPATAVLYGSTVSGWWCCDDSQLLKFAIKYSPWQYFTVPEIWREAVNSSLTPLEVHQLHRRNAGRVGLHLERADVGVRAAARVRGNAVAEAAGAD